MAPFGASRAGLMSVAGDDIPDGNLIRHYPIDDGSGTTIAEVENNENGTFEGDDDDWESNKGRGDPILFHDGSVRTNIPNLSKLSEYTVAITIYFDSTPSDQDSFWGYNENNRIFAFIDSGNIRFFQEDENSDNYDVLIDDDNINVNEWNTFVQRWDGSTMTAEVNADQSGTVSVNSMFDRGSGSAIMDRDSSSGNQATGYPANFAVYDVDKGDDFAQNYHDSTAGSWN